MGKFKRKFYSPHTWYIVIDLMDKNGVVIHPKRAVSSGNVYINGTEECYNYSYLWHIDYARNPKQGNTHFDLKMNESTTTRYFATLTDRQKLILDIMNQKT